MLSAKVITGAEHFQLLNDEDALDLLNHITDSYFFDALRGLVLAGTQNLYAADNASAMLKHASVIASHIALTTAEVYKQSIDDDLDERLLAEQAEAEGARRKRVAGSGVVTL